MSHRALGQQWFHGSDAELEPGTVLTPRGDQARYRGRGEHVYIANTRKVAWLWANAAGGHHVYEVEPLGAVEKDDSEHFGGEHRTTSARVRRKA